MSPSAAWRLTPWNHWVGVEMGVFCACRRRVLVVDGEEDTANHGPTASQQLPGRAAAAAGKAPAQAARGRGSKRKELDAVAAAAGEEGQAAAAAAESLAAAAGAKPPTKRQRGVKPGPAPATSAPLPLGEGWHQKALKGGDKTSPTRPSQQPAQQARQRKPAGAAAAATDAAGAAPAPAAAKGRTKAAAAAAGAGGRKRKPAAAAIAVPDSEDEGEASHGKQRQQQQGGGGASPAPAAGAGKGEGPEGTNEDGGESEEEGGTVFFEPLVVRELDTGASARSARAPDAAAAANGASLGYCSLHWLLLGCCWQGHFAPWCAPLHALWQGQLTRAEHALQARLTPPIRWQVMTL